MSVSVLTQHNNAGRTGVNSTETQLNTSNVNVNQFGMVFKHQVNGQIYAQPLYVPFVNIEGKGVHNTVFVATMDNWVYAFDADDADGSNAQPLWAHQLEKQPPIPARIYNPDYRDVIGNIGILGTPVIDAKLGTSKTNPTTGTMYLVLETWDEAGFAADPLGAFKQLLYALDLATGQPRPALAGRKNPQEISGSVQGTGYATVDVKVNGKKVSVPDTDARRVKFQPMQQLQRPGLLLLDGVLYIAFGSHGDFDPYHGWVFAYDKDTFGQRGIFCSTPNGARAGIWQAGEGLVADADGNVYAGTGNGDTKDSPGVQPDLGESFVQLNLDATALGLVGWLNAFKDPSGGDEDLGAASPTLLPDGQLVGGGKDGNFYLLDPTQMNPTGAQACLLQKFIASFGVGTRPGTQTHHIHGSPVAWESPNHGTLVYVWGENDVLRVYRYDTATHRFPDQPGPGGGQGSPLARGIIYASNDVPTPRQGMPGGMLSISVAGATLNTGIIWGSFPAFGNANRQTIGGQLVAYDASNFDAQGRIVALWTSHQNPRRDDYGNFPKFCCPTIANGKVYQATFSNQLVVYGLLKSPNGGYNLGFGGTTGLTLNGSAQSADGRIRLTGLHLFQAGSVFSTDQANVRTFSTTFRFRLGHAQADGITFTIQSEGTHALGSPGGGLGYGPDPNDPTSTFHITRSVAVKFDLFDNQTLQQRSSTGIYQNGNPPGDAGDIPLDPLGINLHAGTPFRVSMSYDGVTLSVTIRDEVKRVNATQSYAIDIPAITGPKAHIGFTGGTGGQEAEQDILSWDFSS